jgi:hypothetical protein
MCPICSWVYGLLPEQLKPMVLSGDDKSMQCGVCNRSFKLPDCEVIVEMARHQRDKRYDK